MRKKNGEYQEEYLRLLEKGKKEKEREREREKEKSPRRELSPMPEGGMDRESRLMQQLSQS